jgi:hypothetical protein
VTSRRPCLRPHVGQRSASRHRCCVHAKVQTSRHSTFQTPPLAARHSGQNCDPSTQCHRSRLVKRSGGPKISAVVTAYGKSVIARTSAAETPVAALIAALSFSVTCRTLRRVRTSWHGRNPIWPYKSPTETPRRTALACNQEYSDSPGRGAVRSGNVRGPSLLVWGRCRDMTVNSVTVSFPLRPGRQFRAARMPHLHSRRWRLHCIDVAEFCCSIRQTRPHTQVRVALQSLLRRNTSRPLIAKVSSRAPIEKAGLAAA